MTKIQMLKTNVFAFLLRGEKNNPSIIRATCAFDSKIGWFLGRAYLLSVYEKRDKKNFRKIEISQKLPSFFAENNSIFDTLHRLFDATARADFSNSPHAFLCIGGISL